MKKLISLFIICLLTLLYPLNVFASEIDLSNETVDSSVYEISSTPKPVDFDEKEYARATLKENHSKKLKDEVFGGGTESVVMAAASGVCQHSCRL